MKLQRDGLEYGTKSGLWQHIARGDKRLQKAEHYEQEEGVLYGGGIADLKFVLFENIDAILTFLPRYHYKTTIRPIDLKFGHVICDMICQGLNLQPNIFSENFPIFIRFFWPKKCVFLNVSILLYFHQKCSILV